jgi:hypothetical protein
MNIKIVDKLMKVVKFLSDYKNILMILGYFHAFLGLTAVLFSSDKLSGLFMLLINLAIALVFTPSINKALKMPDLRPRSVLVVYGTILVINSAFLLFGKGADQPQVQGIIAFIIGAALVIFGTPKGGGSMSDFKD